MKNVKYNFLYQSVMDKDFEKFAKKFWTKRGLKGSFI